jgi:hypothetical protein
MAVEAHMKEERARGVNLDGGRVGGMGLDGGGDQCGAGVEAVDMAQRSSR